MSGFFFAARGEMEIERTALWINGNSIGLAMETPSHWLRDFKHTASSTVRSLSKQLSIFVK